MSDTVLEITRVVTELVIGEGREQTVLEINEPTVEILTIGTQGPSGRDGSDGVDGIDGSGDLNYVHTQIAAASVWNIVHNLGKHPAITVIDTANTEVEGNLEYLDLNNARLTFSVPFSGSAFCN